MGKKIFKLTAVFFLLILVFFAFAVSLGKIEYPVEGLGNCSSQEECEAYCDQPENIEACIDFAEEKGLIDSEQAEREKKMARLVANAKTPGGCTSEQDCRSYCEESEHFNECISFFEENNLLSVEEIKTIKKFGSFDFKGPGGCQGKQECKEYCKEESHFNECIQFMEKYDLIPPGELKKVKKIGSFSGPGGCVMDECEDFCEKPENFETCIEFGYRHGMISEKEYNVLKKTGGKGPGGCQGEKECEEYCNQPEHGEECLNFSCENGLMSPEECERIRKEIKEGKKPFTAGPGGCKSQEECDAYCEQPEHVEECIDFTCSHGYMSEEECKKAREKLEQERMQEGFIGPSGCKTEEECEEYCSQPEHFEECVEFECSHGLMSEEECEKAREQLKQMQTEEETPSKKIPPEEEKPEGTPPEGKKPPEGEKPEGPPPGGEKPPKSEKPEPPE